MSGEILLVRGAAAGALAFGVPASALAWALRGPRAATSVAVAVAIVLANAVVAAVISAFAGRLGAVAAAMVSLPSFVIRMTLIVGLLAQLKSSPSIDDPVFAVAFGFAVTAVLLLEARAYRRTPWIALTLSTKEQS